jgi:hypothetical protein
MRLGFCASSHYVEPLVQPPLRLHVCCYAVGQVVMAKAIVTRDSLAIKFHSTSSSHDTAFLRTMYSG